MSISETPSGRGEALKLEQKAVLSSYLGLSLKNGLLNLITLTLYRFWGKTEVRRRVWSSTYLNGEPFEYTGRGKELFLGFLIALVVVGVPYLIVVFAAQMLGPVVAGLILLPLYVAMIFLFGYGLFTAFRYMASRTVWRAVRFRLAGSPADYGLRMLAYVAVSGLTLGWFAPTMRRKMAKHLWRNLNFGDLPFRFDEEACRKVKVYPAFALAWAGTFLFYIVVFALTFAASMGMKQSGQAEPEGLMTVMVLIIALVASPILLVFYSAYEAAILRSVVAGIVVSEARFKLRLGWLDMLWMIFSNLLLILISLGFLMPLVQARAAKFLINRVTSEGEVDLSSVRQTEHGPKTGEGLADALDISVI